MEGHSANAFDNESKKGARAQVLIVFNQTTDVRSSDITPFEIGQQWLKRNDASSVGRVTGNDGIKQRQQ